MFLTKLCKILKYESSQNLCDPWTVLLIFVICTSFISCTQHYEIIEVGFESEALRDNPLSDPHIRTVRVIVPPGYKPPDEATERYSTIYILHGFKATDDILDQMTEEAKSHADYWYGLGQIGKMILVIPNAETSLNGNFESDPCGSWYTDSPETGNYKTYITPELVNYIDENFSTISERAKRGISGFSMGGYGSIFLALQQPGKDLFCSVASHSGMLSLEEIIPKLAQPPVIAEQWVRNKAIPSMNAAFSPGLDLNPRIEDGELGYDGDALVQWLEHDPLTYLDTNPAAFSNSSIYIDCGVTDELGFATHAQRFAEKLDELDVQYELHLYQYDTSIEWLDLWMSGHSLINWRLPESLKFHWQQFN